MESRIWKVTGVTMLGLLALVGLEAGRARAGQDRTAPAPNQAAANPDGQTTYREHCAACHDTGVPRAPTRAALAQMSADNIRFALTTGKMSAQGAELTRAQLDALIRFLTGAATSSGQPAPATGCRWRGETRPAAARRSPQHEYEAGMHRHH